MRLVEGDFDRETAFDADPLDAALRWERAGASWIHIVDLDGARSGTPFNRETVQRIRANVGCRLQLGGGIRTDENINEILEMGIDRVILGSIAVTDPDIVISAVAIHGDRIAVGLDARDGRLATSGWKSQTDADAFDVARVMGDAGVRHIIFTDIHRDGTLAGPNTEALQSMVACTRASVIASGGIGSTEDVLSLADTGVSGVIVGRALYDGRVDLQQLLGAIADA